MKKLLLYLAFLLALTINAQTYTNELYTWDRIRFNYINDKITFLGDYEYRGNLTNKTHINNCRLYIQSNKKIRLGAGIIYRPDVDELRLYQTINYNIHQFMVEQRIYPDHTNLRLRYMISETYTFGKKDNQSILLGLEPMLEGQIDPRQKPLKPTVTRFYITLGQKISKPLEIQLGYICEMSNTFAKHIIRLSLFYTYKKVKPVILED